MQVLRAVVTSGSVTAAAAQLGYTPSAVSRQVAVLEKEAGIALLERVGRGVRPTAAGRLLTGHAAVIGRQVAEAETALADLRAGRTDRLSMRYFASVGPTWWPPRWPGSATTIRACRSISGCGDPEDPLREVDRRADLALWSPPGRRGAAGRGPGPPARRRLPGGAARPDTPSPRTA